MEHSKRPCKSCGTLIDYIKYRPHCLECYLKYLRSQAPKHFKLERDPI